MSSTVPAESRSAITSRLALLRNRTFQSIWFGSVISLLGDGFHVIALGLLVLQKTGSATAMSSIFAVRFLASILVGPIAGTFVDRVDRRRLMIGADLIRVLLVVLLILVVRSSSFSITLVILLSFVISLVGTFFSPAFSASLINIVSEADIAKASSLLQLTSTISGVAGPILGGIVAASIGGTTALAVDAVSFFVSAMAILLVRFPSPVRDGQKRGNFIKDLKSGFSYLKNQPVIFGVTLLGPAFSLFGAANSMLIPVIAIRLWHANGIEYGLLQSTWAIGTAIAATALTLFSKLIKRRGALIVTMFALSGVMYMIAPIMPNGFAAMPFLIACGILSGGGITIMIILMRTIVPAEYQGRVFGFYGSLANAAWPVGAYLAGFLADRMSAIDIAVLCGAGFLLTGLAGWLNLPLRNFQ